MDKYKLMTLGPLVLAFFFLPSLIFAKTIKIGVFDTGFCLEKLPKLAKNIQVQKPIDATKTNQFDCNTLKIRSKRLHGQRVLNLFIEKLNPLRSDQKIELFPIIIFDKNGNQKIDYWRKALKRSKDLKLDLLMAAAGKPLITGEMNFPKIHIPMLLSSGRSGGKIKADTKLWPQIEKNKNLILVGSFYPPLNPKNPEVLEDQSLLNREKISIYMSSGINTDIIQGTSRAVALATSKAINLCFDKRNEEIFNCIRKHIRQIKIEDSKRSLPTL